MILAFPGNLSVAEVCPRLCLPFGFSVCTRSLPAPQEAGPSAAGQPGFLVVSVCFLGSKVTYRCTWREEKEEQLLISHLLLDFKPLAWPQRGVRLFSSRS